MFILIKYLSSFAANNIANLFIFGHYRKSGEIVFDNVEGFIIKFSKESIYLRNLFNGNKFLEKTGNVIINNSDRRLVISAMQKAINEATKNMKEVLNQIFLNTTKTEFESYFPDTKSNEENEEIDEKIDEIKNRIDFSTRKLHKTPLNQLRNLQKQVENLFFYVKLMTVIFIIFIVICLIIFFIVKVHISSLKINLKETKESDINENVKKQLLTSINA
jgi:hypothetical protein